MNSSSSPSRSTTALLLLTAVMCAIGLRFYPYSLSEETSSSYELPAPLKFAEGMVTRPLSALTNTRSRPVFSSSRRPGAIDEEPVEEIDPTPASNVLDLKLMGTLLRGNNTRALIGWPNNLEGIWIDEGGEVDRWTLTDVKFDQVTLHADDETQTLTLFPGSNVPEAELDVEE